MTAGEQASVELVQGRGDDCELELGALARAMIAWNVEFAVSFPKKAGIEKMRCALAETLPAFGPLAGRIVQRDEGIVVLQWRWRASHT